MARVADYGIVTAGSFSIGSKGSTQSKVFHKALPSNLNRRSRSVLSYVIRNVNVGDVFKVQVRINDVVVENLSYDDVQFGMDRTLHNAIGGNILKPGAKNNITFYVKSEVAPGGKVTFSDVVIWFQANV